jgi:hypothetical protein
MSDREKKKRRVLRRGWVTIWGSVAEGWVKRAKLPRQSVGDDLYVPVWVRELHLHLLPDEPPSTEEHMAPIFQIGEALRSGTLTKETVEAAHRLGGPEAVAALAAGLT